jgi:hypothetical protein
MREPMSTPLPSVRSSSAPTWVSHYSLALDRETGFRDPPVAAAKPNDNVTRLLDLNQCRLSQRRAEGLRLSHMLVELAMSGVALAGNRALVRSE